VGFALLKDLGDQVSRLQVIVGLARPGPLSFPGLAASDGGCRQLELVEELTIGPPEGATGFKDVEGCGAERLGQAPAFLDKPQGIGQVLVLDLALAQNILAVGQRMDENGGTGLLVGVNATRQIETVLQGLASSVVVTERIVLVLKRRIEETGKGHRHRILTSSLALDRRNAQVDLVGRGCRNLAVIHRSGSSPPHRFPIKGRYPALPDRAAESSWLVPKAQQGFETVACLVHQCRTK